MAALVLVVWLMLCASCGGGGAAADRESASPPPRRAEPWEPLPAALGSVDCGHSHVCDRSAELRVRFPFGAPPPFDARVLVDGVARSPSALALGDCVPPGAHRLRVETVVIDETSRVTSRAGEADVEVRPGAITEVELAPGDDDTSLVLRATRRVHDPVAALVALGPPTLPDPPADPADPASVRAFHAALEAALERFASSLESVVAGAREASDVILVTSATEALDRVRAMQASVRTFFDAGDALPPRAAERLRAWADRLADEAARAPSMIAVTYRCELFSPLAQAPLAPLFITFDPEPLFGLRVSRVRLAVDGALVLDRAEPHLDFESGEPRDPVGERTVSGLVAPGAHELEAEVTFRSARMTPYGYDFMIRVRHRARVDVAEHGAGARVRAGRRGSPTTPIEEALFVEIVASPREPSGP